MERASSGPIVWLGIILTTCRLLLLFQTAGRVYALEGALAIATCRTP